MSIIVKISLVVCVLIVVFCATAFAILMLAAACVDLIPEIRERLEELRDADR